MTFKNFIKEYLERNGMFETQADETIQLMKESEIGVPMADIWERSVEHYPDGIKNIAIFSAKIIGLEYIKKNCPEAWFRVLFEDEVK